MRALQVFPWRETDRLVPLAQGLVEFAVAATVLYLLGRFLLVPAIDWFLDARGVEPTLASATQKVVRTGLVVLALIFGAAFAGFTALLGGSALLAAAGTLALGFAAQEVIGNFVSGIFIVRDRQFSIGDWIEWDGNVGVIHDISFRVTRVRTFNNEMVTVPNADLATSVVTNRMSGDTLRVTSVFGVEYGADLAETREILLSVADDHPAILADPSPTVEVAELAGDSIDLEARFWIEEPSRREFLNVRSAFLQEAAERLEAADIAVGTITDLAGEFDVRATEGAVA